MTEDVEARKGYKRVRKAGKGGREGRREARRQGGREEWRYRREGETVSGMDVGRQGGREARR